jgi:hypothetical protein
MRKKCGKSWAWLGFFFSATLLNATDMNIPDTTFTPPYEEAPKPMTRDDLQGILRGSEPDILFALVQIIGTEEADMGTRHYHTRYQSRIIKPEVKVWQREVTFCSLGPPSLEPGGYYLVFHASWLKQRSFFSFKKERNIWMGTSEVKYDEKNGLAAYDNTMRTIEDILKDPPMLPDATLRNVLAGKAELVVGSVRNGSPSIPGFNPGIPYQVLYVNEAIVGEKRDIIPITLGSFSELQKHVDYLIAVSTGAEVSDHLEAVEIYPSNRERILKRYKDRLKALAAQAKGK